MTTDIDRPELHVTAETGVLNAPAGVLNDHETWHVLYQFQPQLGGPARWGHVMSLAGPFDWIECDDVLAPQSEETTLRAGSIVAEGAGVDIYFTSGQGARSEIHRAAADAISDPCVVSDEPSTLNPSVLRTGPAVVDREGYSNFRSPAVVPGWQQSHDREAGHAGWLMLAVTGETSQPVPVILTSVDGQEWDFVGPLSFEGDPGLPSASSMTAPRIMRLRDQVDNTIYDVLLVTLEQDGIDQSGYLVGQLDGAVFQVVRGFNRIDFGHDFVRPRSAEFVPGTIPENERNEQAVVFGLMNGVGRQDDPSTHRSQRLNGWANTLSLPRVVTLQGGILYQTPRPGLIDAISESERARAWSGLCEIPSGSELTVSLIDGHGNVAARIIHSGDTLTLDRSTSLDPRTTEPAQAPLRDDDSDTLTIIVDGSTVEVFADGGQVAMASRVYFDGGCSGVEVNTSGDAEILSSWERAGS